MLSRNVVYFHGQHEEDNGLQRLQVGRDSRCRHKGIPVLYLQAGTDVRLRHRGKLVPLLQLFQYRKEVNDDSLRRSKKGSQRGFTCSKRQSLSRVTTLAIFGANRSFDTPWIAFGIPQQGSRTCTSQTDNRHLDEGSHPSKQITSLHRA